MASTSQRPKGRDGVLSTLDLFIQVLGLAKDTCGIPPAQAAFASAIALLTVIRDTMANNQDYVELGQACGEVCQALDRGLDGRQLHELNRSVLGAIGQLTTTIAEIQGKVVNQGKQNVASRAFHAKVNKDKIAVWRQDLVRVLLVFNTELAVNTHTMVGDLHRNMLRGQGGVSGKSHPNQASFFLGEFPPPPPRDSFGREDLIEKVVGLAEKLEPIALIGAGGIGKTSVALTVLHHDRIKRRFGENRRFVRCEQILASRASFLARLSKAIGSGIENPEDLASLRPFLSSKEILIILDNAESVLDPQGTDAGGIYSVVQELCRFKTVCLLITSRITTVPPRCKRPEILMLSMEAACDIFYSIFGDRERSSIISDLLRRLDFHALSITLLATTASHHAWDYDRLVKEWDEQRVQVLQAGYNESLAATIELSLISPTFRSLGPNARDLLGVVAFFPQGIDENNLDWLFPAISNRKNIFDQFCLLSLTYRSNGFVKMLAPIRDYLRPQHPQSSQLLCATRDHYFIRLAVDVYPDKPGFEEARWIVLEDVNVEHLLEVFTSISPNMGVIWDACGHFIEHLLWHKPRQTILKSRIEALPDDHHSKPKCLFELSRLFAQLGQYPEIKRLLTHALELERQRGDDSRVAKTLESLSSANRVLYLREEGIRQAKEALEIFEGIGDVEGQASCLNSLACLSADQVDAAENFSFRGIDLVSETGQEYLLCGFHSILGAIYQLREEKEKAICYYKTALVIASRRDWRSPCCHLHLNLAGLFLMEEGFDKANTHIELAKSYATHDALMLGRVAKSQSEIWHRQHRLEDAKSEALRALEIFEKLGAAKDEEDCRAHILVLERATNSSFQRAKRAIKRLGERFSGH